MQRRTRKNLILVAFVLVLGIAAGAQILHDGALAPTPLLAESAAAVRRIQLDCPACVTRKFERVHGQWLLVEPFAAPAQAQMIAKILAVANEPARRHYEFAKLDAERVGLNAPIAVLKLDNHKLEFGGVDSLNRYRYVRTAQRIALIKDDVSAFLTLPAEALLDRKPIAPLSELVRATLAERELSQQELTALAALSAMHVSQSVGSESDGVSLQVFDSAGDSLAFSLREIDGNLQITRDDLKISYHLAGKNLSNWLQP